jgi:serine/threonine protein kinase
MLCGRPPHYQPKAQKQMLKDICEKPVPMKDYFSPESK